MSAWSLGQAWSQTAQVSTASTTITGPAASVVGRVLVLWIWYAGSGITISSITDNATGGTNSYTTQGIANIGASGLTTAISTAVLARVPAGGMTITVTLSAAPTLFCLAAVEYNGVTTSSPLIDPVSIIQDTNNGWIEELVTSTYSDALYITGTYSNNNTTIVASTGWTLRANNTTGQAAADSLGGNLGNVVGPPLNPSNTAPNTSAVSFAILATDSVLVGKNSPVATPNPPPNFYCRGVFGLSTVDEPSPGTLPYWTQANLMGYAARFSWAALEPTEGTFNWTPIDTVISLAQTNSKYVSLGVLTNPGPSSGVTKQPSWLGSSSRGACSTYTYWNAANTVSTVGYAPWDPIFQYFVARFITAFGQRYDGNKYICYIAIDSGVGDGEANITKGTNGLAQLNALGGVPIWVNAMENGYWPSYFSSFRKIQIIFVTGAPVPGDNTTVPGMLQVGTSTYGSQFGFKSDGLVANTPPSDFFNQYIISQPIAFQFSQTGSVPDSQFAAVMANGFTLGGDITKLGGIAFEIYKPQATGSANIQNVLSLYNSLLFYNGNNPIVPAVFPPFTWISNGSDVTGNTGPYVPNTQAVQYIVNNFALSGDIVQIPNGNYTWGTGITVGLGVTIAGQTAGSVFLINNVSANWINLNSGTDNHIKFQNINIYSTTTGSGSFFAMVVGRTLTPATNPYTVIISGCVINGAQRPSGGSYDIHYLTNGIILSGCTFIGAGSNGLGGVFSDCTIYGYTGAWNYPDTIGATATFDPTSTTQLGTGDVGTSVAPNGLNNSYIENCTFYDATETCLDCDENTRLVFRYNTLINSNIGSHGQETSIYGVRHWEIYNNDFMIVIPGITNTSQWSLSAGFTQPAIGATVVITLNQVSQLFAGQLVSLNTYDIYQITRITAGTNQITIRNLGWPLGTAAGSSIGVQNLVGAGGKTYNIFSYNFPYHWEIRGGTGTVHDNIMPDIATATGGGYSGAALSVSDFGLTEGINDSAGGVFWPQNYGASPSGYPAPRQTGWGWIANSTLWGYGTDQTNPSFVGGTNPGQWRQNSTGVILNPFYCWNNNPAQNAGAFINVHNGPGSNPFAPSILATAFIVLNREYYLTPGPPGYTTYVFPHPLAPVTGSGNTTVSGSILVTGSVLPTLVISTTTGAGLTAVTDAIIARTIVGASGGYVPPVNNWMALFSTQFSAQLKAGAVEWLASSTPGYARQPLGPAGTGWTIAAYANGIGVTWSNTNVINHPVVAINQQTLSSLGFCDALNAGNINFFIDINSSLIVPIGTNVRTLALTGIVFTTY